ncbi:MAG: MFS transporter [Prevotella sp.]|nr:MFS transporter [Bacteroides sp.]MCM1366458.1 MFS transporter [Prevotella sp.]MCM1437062.1 MFS transporter [Prevotella sp.]
MKKSLIALAAATFALGIAEFGMMGILSDVAHGIGVDIVKAGHLISAYSLGVAIGAPCLVVLRKLPLRRLLLFLVTLIAFGNLFTALAPNYIMLLTGRFISGLPHGAFFGAGAIVCSELAGKNKGATAVSVMVGGMTVANVIGVPGATFLSNCISWRFVFGAISLFGIIAFAGIRFWIPKLNPLPNVGGIKGEFGFLKKLAPWLIYGGVFFGQGSVYCWLSYIDPIMTKVSGFAMSDMSWIMMEVGLGMVVGNLISGKLADKYGVSKVCGVAAVSVIFIMTAIYFTASVKLMSVIFAFLAPAMLFAIGGPLQYAIVKFARGGEMLGGAGIQIAFNVSNACAAAMGGIVINAGLGYQAVALAGAPLAAVGAVMLFVLNRKYGGNDGI